MDKQIPNYFTYCHLEKTREEFENVVRNLQWDQKYIDEIAGKLGTLSPMVGFDKYTYALRDKTMKRLDELLYIEAQFKDALLKKDIITENVKQKLIKGVKND